MVRFGKTLLKDVGVGINKTLSEFLVCPLSKQPLSCESSITNHLCRVCEKTNSLISDTIGVSYPIVDGIPHLVPADGKIIETNDASDVAASTGVKGSD